MKYMFGLLIAIGAIGLLGILLFTMANESLNGREYNLAVISAILSMALMLCGIYGCNECKKRLP